MTDAKIEKIEAQGRSEGAVRDAAVLAGGRSRRMGVEKALLAFDGRPLIERAIGFLGERFERVLVSVGADGPSAACARAVAGAAGGPLRVDFVRDRRRAAGPLAAIESVLGALEGPAVVVVAVDVPALDAALIQLLVEIWARTGAPAVVPQWERGVEPLCALYARAALPLVTSLLDRGERAARTLAALPGAIAPDLRRGAEHRRRLGDGFDPAAVFRNLNTPEDCRGLRGNARPS